MTELNDFKVEELEQRLEMSGWSAGTEETPNPDGADQPYETTPYVRYTIDF